MSEDFSNYPTSLQETKADKADDATLWSPRDLLISMLRDLDKGIIKPVDILICWSEKFEGEGESPLLRSTRYRQSVTGTYIGMGLLERVKYLINAG